MTVKVPIKQSEDQLQRNCIKWFRLQHKNLYWRLFAIPNGGKRNKATAAIMQGTGTLSGTWDLFLSVPKMDGLYGGMFIEMKVGKNQLTENQLKFQFENPGYRFRVCRTLDDFIKDVNDYLSL